MNILPDFEELLKLLEKHGVDRIPDHSVANDSVEKMNCKFLVESLNFFGMVIAIVVRELSL